MPNGGGRAAAMRAVLIALAAVAVALPVTARAQTFYLGTWRVASAVVAPWSDAANPDPAEMKSIVGKTVIFRPGAIDGPKPLACGKLKYKVSEGGADMLFQGELAEPREGKAPPAPAAAAAALGFRGGPWKTLETGCANELEFHFLDEKTAEFGLNNYVYRMEKN